MPFEMLDALWYLFESGIEISAAAEILNKTEDEIKTIYNIFKRKIKIAQYLSKIPVKLLL
jgi:hypothetical protein